jgi:hypothetical protein
MVSPSFAVHVAGVPARQLLAPALDGLLTSLLPQIALVRLWIQQRQTPELEFAKTLSLGGGIRTFALEICVPLASR